MLDHHEYYGISALFIQRIHRTSIDALFETVSGFTTTGASILSDVESLPRCILFWRSFTHWIGGMGVLVFLLSILPMTGGSHINLMKAESPGPIVGRITPTVQSTAKTLYKIYVAMTVLKVLLLLLGNMPLFDALTTAFGTAGTGGGIKVSRFVILLKTIRKELHQFLHPKSIKKIKIDGKSLEHEVVRNTNVFLITYVILFSFSILFLAFDDLDLITNFTAVAATFNNIGPVLELVGPASNFSIFSYPAKLILIFDMLAGRLEIFPILLLFVRDTWKRF